MTAAHKGSVTIFLALAMTVFLTLCLVLVEGSRMYFFRVKAMQAAELAEFSVLSEYQKELFEHYGLFFLDLDYEQGSEQAGILEQRVRNYLTRNAEELVTKNVHAEKFRRAADAKGAAFFEQAVETMKISSGYKAIEQLLENVGTAALEDVDLEDILRKKESTADGIASRHEKNEEGQEVHISIPNISFPSIASLTRAVFGNEDGLSDKMIDPEERIMNRKLSEGVGRKTEASIADMQLFYGYIFKHCSCYGADDAEVWKESLEYQLEYIISGRESDRGNIENIMWRIFLLRSGSNYLFYHQDAQMSGKAQAEAVALVGFLGNAALIEAVKEIFLISQAIEDGIDQTRKIFAGEKVPFYQNGIFSGMMLGYEEYLYLFLNTAKIEETVYRCMDIVEMETREKSGYQMLCLDRCVDEFEIQWEYQGSFLNGDIYENAITRQFYYED